MVEEVVVSQHGRGEEPDVHALPLTEDRVAVDFDELSGYDFATYCRGEATRWGGDVVTPFQANVPVVFSGVGIYPGDYVYADHSGAAVIPASEIREVLAGARAVVEEDVGYVEQIKDEAPGSPPQDER